MSTLLLISTGLACRVKSADVVLNAIWDLMTSQADTHGENIFVDVDGTLTHVDIDEAFGHRGIPSGFNSLFLPTSQENAINALGKDFVLKQPNGRPPRQPTYPNPREFGIQYLLDYRCHAEGGAIGKNYPKKVQALLERLSKMTAHEVQCPSLHFTHAHFLRQTAALSPRARLMLCCR